MPKIPDDTALGERPSAAPMRPPDIGGTGSGDMRGASLIQAEANRAGALSADLSKSLGNAGTRIADAEQRMAARLDAVDRARLYGQFTEEAEEGLRTLATTADLSRPETLKKFAQERRDALSALVNAHGGSDESKAILAERLSGIHSTVIQQGAVMASAAEQQVVKGRMGNVTNVLSAEARQPGSDISKLFTTLDTQINDLGPAIQPGDEEMYRRVGRSNIIEA